MNSHVQAGGSPFTATNSSAGMESACRRICRSLGQRHLVDPEPLKHLSSDGKCACVTPIDHGASDHDRTRAKIREPIKVNVVKNSHTVGCQCLVVEAPEFLVAPVLCTQAGSNLKDFFASRRRDKDLHGCKVSPATLGTVAGNSVTRSLRPSSFRSLRTVSRYARSYPGYASGAGGREHAVSAPADRV